MSLEWFDRVCSELQDSMESICEQYDEVGQIQIDRASKHPKIECYIELDDGERDYFCSLLFDPHNEEFYIVEYDLETEHTARIILDDIDDIIEVVHETFHDAIDAYELVDEEIVESDEYEEEGVYVDSEELEEGVFEEVIIDVDWTTPEVLAYSYLDEVEVAYRFGIVQETGDGVLRRVNRIVTEDDTVIEDESDFVFSKEEAGTIIELIEGHMDEMDGFDHE
ncbi:hypothetical protein [Alkalihalobacterium bogoriense]|uniref:hypothetical protein n=1 Tax=Alkalihalobacterium bogoriense TaxID=246272 RepID=UPI000479D652|nr:hypothetical protein [Alkalihalobacterium bogoriense]